MKTLTIEHLAAYLPYGVNMVMDTSEWFEPEGDVIVNLSGVRNISYEDYISVSYIRTPIVTGNDYSGRFKPILRPLSQLTEPITHNGETFVPIDRLVALFGNGFDYDSIWDSTEKYPYEVVKYLHSLHFDTFNLGADSLCIYMNNDGTLAK